MPTFQYRAIGPAGDVLNGTMDAPTAADVIARLQRQGNIPMRAEPARTGSFLGSLLHFETGGDGQSLRRQDVADIMRELATMLAAGQDLDRALRYLTETAPNSRVRVVVG